MKKDAILISFIVSLLTFMPLHAASLNAPAPKFSLKDSHKQLRTLSEDKGKVVFINFWASWCAPCRLELPELDRLAATYQGKKFQILAINVDSDRKAGQTRLVELGLKNPGFEVLWDTRSRTVTAYNIETMPSSFILDPKGIIRFTHTGFRAEDPPVWRNEIDTLLRQQSH
jgi:thiol-disulfide isomerase/thioredoxin